jgi:PKD repeat protein
VLALCLLATLVPSAARSAAGDVGFEGPSTSGTGTPTGTKRAESVLWWNDGSWWANMWDAASADFHIFRLDSGTHGWVDTGVRVDERPNTHADVLWDGTSLYVASHRFVDDGVAAVSGYASYLYRFSYDRALRTYRLDAGFPVTINNWRTETLVIDKDSTGKLWATWQQENQIYVNRTLNGDDRTWGTPFALPVAGTAVSLDDTSSLLAFGGNAVGVMWSNQTSTRDGMYFAVHNDGDPDGSWQASRTAIQGSGSADDHMNLKSLGADSSGRVFAAVKTSFTTSSAPLIMLLARNPATGDWTSHPIARVSDCPNRPIVLVDAEKGVLHAFYTAPASPAYACSSSGGAIYEKTSPLNAISFPVGAGTVVIQDADSPYVHNVNSTKQNVNSNTGIVILAANGRTTRYWHHEASIEPSGGPAPPSAAFSATPVTGTAPLAVSFTDTSTGSPTSWSWNFGDGGTSTAQNPTHTYRAAGKYTVSLTVSNASGSDTLTRTDYVAVTTPPPSFEIAASPSSTTIVRGSTTTYQIVISPRDGFVGRVDLAVSGLPDGVSASFAPNPVEVATLTSSTLTVTTTTAAKPGGSTLTITGRSGQFADSTTVTLQIKRK